MTAGISPTSCVMHSKDQDPLPF